MERFLSPGSHCKDPVETPPPKAKAKGKPKGRPVGRPKSTGPEGALDLGEKRPRICHSKKAVINEQRMQEMQRQIEVLQALVSEDTVDAKIQKVLALHEQSVESNKQMRDLLTRAGKHARPAGEYVETPDRKPSGGCPSPGGCEVGSDVGSCEAVGKHFGILGRRGGTCEAALRGGALGDCEKARTGGQHTPEILEKCRQQGKEGGILGAVWGKFGGRPASSDSVGSAPAMAQKGLVRPQKWEPKVGHQLHAVKYIRERLRARREGKFTQEEGASQEKWEEPEASDVEMAVWSQIREE